MKSGLGIDSIEINRFNHWNAFSQKRLLRLFSHEELSYCLAKSPFQAQHFAVRFAAKEAFFKAWNSAQPNHYAPFLTFCKAVSLTHGRNNEPHLILQSQLLPEINASITSLISVTHTRTVATACVFLQFSN